MRLVKKILKVLFIILVLVFAGGSFFIHNLANRAVPDYNKDVVLAGLKDEVKVYRDSFAVPHVYANDEADLYYVIGYIMAQDRLWQMDLLRRVTQGRLAEIFGEDFVEADLLLRALRIPEQSAIIKKETKPEIFQSFVSFSKGVNAYIEDHKKKLPPEFSILGYEPDKWEPEHSLNLIGYMAWDLAGGTYSTEITIYKLIKKFGQENIAELIPDVANRKEVVYADFEIDTILLNKQVSLISGSKKLDELGVKVFFGSNNWAVSGKKSLSGISLMANDMHLGLNSPGIWYQIHEVTEDGLNVTGVAVPGTPIVIAGHNEDIAWGMTHLYMDDIDLYLEKTNPDNSNEYWYNGKWNAMEVRNEVIKVKGGKEVIRENRFTHRGPIISGFKNMEQAISMRWIGNEKSDVLKSMYLMNRAENWDDFKEALRSFISLGQNVIYADKNGNIGLYAAGGVPVRKGPGWMIHTGETDEYDWKGQIPFDELPHVYNPESGMVSSANNKTVGNDYPYYIGFIYSQGYRVNRIREMLNEKDKFSVEDFAAMQADQKSWLVKEFLPDILRILNSADLSKKEKIGRTILTGWNGIMEETSPAPLIFDKLYLTIIKNILSDDLGEDLYKEYYSNGALSRNFMENIWYDKDNKFWDDLNTQDKTEGFAEIIIKSYREVMEDLSSSMGNNPKKWQWGDVHQLTLEHPLGKVKILDKVFGFNRGPYRVGGSFNTVSPFAYSFSSPFKAIHGASQRHVFSPEDWDKSITIIPTGESGISASPYYCDQTELYLKNIYHADPFSREKVEGRAKFMAVFKGQEK
jgi:penicillin amidase